MKPLLFAHRGDRVHYPENTFDAFRSAFALGADGVECDIQENDKGEIIIVHDYLYDRTKQYPLFKDFLKEFSSQGRLEIELKTISASFVDKIATIINEYKPIDYELTSSILPLLPLVRLVLPEVTIGVIFKPYLLESWMTKEFSSLYILSYMKLLKANVLHLKLESYSQRLVELLHQNNFRLHTHLSDNNIDKYNQIVALGIDQCTFDDITLLQRLER